MPHHARAQHRTQQSAAQHRVLLVALACAVKAAENDTTIIIVATQPATHLKNTRRFTPLRPSSSPTPVIAPTVAGVDLHRGDGTAVSVGEGMAWPDKGVALLQGTTYHCHGSPVTTWQGSARHTQPGSARKASGSWLCCSPAIAGIAGRGQHTHTHTHTHAHAHTHTHTHTHTRAHTHTL